MSKLLFACVALAAMLLLLQACQMRPTETAPAPQAAAPAPVPAPAPQAAAPAPEAAAPEAAEPLCTATAEEAERGQCFKLVPAGTSSKKDGKGKSIVFGRCQPQSLIYTRCRTGITTCRLGDTSPVQWFACEKKGGRTTATPAAGAVLILDVNKRRGMPTGHTAYVEEVCPEKGGTYLLRISHTNYDRKCHLDQDCKVRFDPKTMRCDFLTGAWAAWAKGLVALGFIVKG